MNCTTTAWQKYTISLQVVTLLPPDVCYYNWLFKHVWCMWISLLLRIITNNGWSERKLLSNNDQTGWYGRRDSSINKFITAHTHRKKKLARTKKSGKSNSIHWKPFYCCVGTHQPAWWVWLIWRKTLTVQLLPKMLVVGYVPLFRKTQHIDFALLSNISPVSWRNIILYGDYILNRNKVQR